MKPAVIDFIWHISVGLFAIYMSRKLKTNDQAKFLKIGGIAMIVFSIILAAFDVYRKK